MSRVKFATISRVIDPKTRMHYLDAIDAEGRHWTAEMSPKLEQWLVYTKKWTLTCSMPENPW